MSLRSKSSTNFSKQCPFRKRPNLFRRSVAVERALELSDLLDEVHRIEVQAKRLVTDVMAGSYSSVFRGAGIEFDEVREYEEGDDPRTVDWNVTARVGRPFVKKYTDERRLTVLFLLDLSESMTGGFGFYSVRQIAARFCACLAFAAVRNNDRVGLITVGDKVQKNVPAQKGVGHALRIIRDCLALPATGTQTNLAPALDLAARATGKHAILFVLSDFLSEGWQRPLRLCSRRHDVIAVRLLSPELTPPPRGLMRLQDPESGHQVIADWSRASVREQYLQRIADWKQRTEQSFRRAQVDWMDIPIPRDQTRDVVARPILEFFRMRELRGAKR